MLFFNAELVYATPSNPVKSCAALHFLFYNLFIYAALPIYNYPSHGHPSHSLFSLFYYQKYYACCLTFSFSIYSQLDEKDDAFPPFTGYSFLNFQDNSFRKTP